MSWAKLYDSVLTHPKLKKLARRLSVSHYEARSLMVHVWLIAQSSTPDGDFSSWTEEDLLLAIDYPKEDPPRIFDAMIECRLMDENRRLHSWDFYHGSRKEAKRKGNYRERMRSQNVPGQTGNVPGQTTDVPGQSQDSVETPQQSPRTGLSRDKDGTVPGQMQNVPGQTGNVPGLSGQSADCPHQERQERQERQAKPKVKSTVPLTRHGEICSNESEIHQVFEHYRKYHPRAAANPSSKQREWRLIRDRLREGRSVEELQSAIDGCHKSAFHCGENDGRKKYQSLALIMRDDSHVLGFIEQNERGIEPVVSRKTVAADRAALEIISKRRAELEENAAVS